MTTNNIRIHPCQAMVPYDNGPERIAHDNPSLIDLAASIQSKGLQQRPLVRPSSHGSVIPYEVVFGARRLHACMVAGLIEIEVELRDLSDAEARELRTIENLQREDLPPYEEAKRVAEVVSTKAGNYETASELLGLSTREISQCMAVTNLIDAWLPMLEPDQPLHLIDLDRLAVIGRYPAHVQGRLFERFCAHGSRQSPGDLLDTSINDLRKYCDAFLSRKLPPLWTMEFEEAGICCATCPKRASVQPSLFPEAHALPNGKDTCLDYMCYGLRQTNYLIRKRVDFETKNEGRSILMQRPESKSLYDYLIKAKFLVVPSYLWDKGAKAKPDSVPLMTETGKTIWVSLREYNLGGMDQRTEITKLVNEWKQAKGKMAKKQATKQTTMDGSKDAAPAQPKSTIGDRMLQKMCKIVVEVLEEEREKVWDLDLKDAYGFSGPNDLIATVLAFGLHKQDTTHGPETWDLWHNIMGCTHYDQPILDYDAVNYGQFNPIDTMPKCFITGDERPRKLSVRQMVFMHWLKIMHSRLGLCGGPATDVTMHMFNANQFHHGQRGVALQTLYMERVAMLVWPKAWFNEVGTSVLDDLIYLCECYLEACLTRPGPVNYKSYPPLVEATTRARGCLSHWPAVIKGLNKKDKK